MDRFNADTVSWYSETVHLGGRGGGVREGKKEDERRMDEGTEGRKRSVD